MEFKLDFELEDFYDFLLISFGSAWVDGWFLLNLIITSALSPNLWIERKTFYLDLDFSLTRKSIFLDQLLGFLPSKIIPDETEHLLDKERIFYGNIMIDTITFNLNDFNEEEEVDGRSNSPIPENDLLFQIKLHVRSSNTIGWC